MTVNTDTRDIAHRSHVDSEALLYETAFNRSPDDGGLNFYDDQLDAGVSLHAIAQQFVDAPEFQSLYSGLSRDQVTDQMYLNVLGRHAEGPALTYWGSMSVADALVGISQSMEAQTVQANGLHGYEQAVSNDMTGGGHGELSSYAQAPEVVTVPGPVQYVDVPGPTQYVPVPGPTVVVDAPDATTTLNTHLDAQFTNASGNQFLGDGTTPANLFNTVTQDGITLGLDVLPRQTDTAFGGGEYLARSSTFDGVTLHVTHVAPSGPQDTDNGSFQDVANRGAVNQGLLIGTDSDTFTFAEAIAQGYKFQFQADTDNTAAQNLLTFTAVVDQANGSLDFVDGNGNGFTGFNGNSHVASESFQQNFVTPGGVAALTDGAQFDNYLHAYGPDGSLVASYHETLILGVPGYSPADQFA
jgi:hypothetical protein